MTRPHIEPFCDQDVHFKNMSLTGFPTGFSYKMLSLDPEVGSCTMTVQLAGGYKQKPGFSYSELEMVVVEGSMTVGDTVCSRSHYFFIPAGYAMPEISTEQGCILLMMYNTGEPSHEESDEHHPLSRTELYHDVDTYRDIIWSPGNVVSPSVASGCMAASQRTSAASFWIDLEKTMQPRCSFLPMRAVRA